MLLVYFLKTAAVLVESLDSKVDGDGPGFPLDMKSGPSSPDFGHTCLKSAAFTCHEAPICWSLDLVIPSLPTPC